MESSFWSFYSSAAVQIALDGSDENVLDALDADHAGIIVTMEPHNDSLPGQKWYVNDDGRISVINKDDTKFCLSKIDKSSDPIVIKDCGTGPDSSESVRQGESHGGTVPCADPNGHGVVH
ncbi:hypothetical protein I302_105541 [Kwoniella bestiolae CBS 10118]|uniref:Uncharacterized protein n=1 Tax=Kwoniella bestiolae CBS 10118 TaxID=1296100 RepID=A0A1B9FTF7_9TREE|nr:hypothetical protein I302_08824 [Kwoniella bestiolae CBS 10118]OCF22043.1 hypothetical protein I302_08824 [Kwoniella bestiolae CBS 10118]